MDQKKIREKLDRVQHLTCIAVTGALRTSPTLALGALMGLLSLDLFTKTTVSVYQAEMLRLVHALDHLIGGKVQGKTILIALDNQSVIRCMDRTHIDSKLAQECAFKLSECAFSNEATLMWVKGHSGIGGNELADELAKKGSSSAFVGPEPRVALIKGSIRALDGRI